MGTAADDIVMRRSDEYDDRGDHRGYQEYNGNDPYAQQRDHHDPYAQQRDHHDPYAQQRDHHDPYEQQRDQRDPYGQQRDQRDPYGQQRDQRDPYGQQRDHYDPYGGERPRYLENMVRGTSHNFYINGDYFFPGKKVHCNRRQIKDLPHYLDHLTEKLGPRFGAVHRILTPRHGRPVRSLDELQNDQNYVVAGLEKFRHLQYDQITPSERKRSPPFKYDASPVYHARQLQCSGKINKIDTHSVLITVWPNGNYLRGPRRVLIPPRVMKTNNIFSVVDEVNTFLKNDCVGTVEKLYMPSGIKVSDCGQILSNYEYIACKRSERLNLKGFRRRPNVDDPFSPRGGKLPSIPNTNSTQNSSPENSNASTGYSPGNGYGQRRRGYHRREADDQVFPAKPVKHTRHTQQVDLDKDEGGLFKAKQNNRNTRGAQEIQDTRHTKTEVPVDQQEAREVEDEDIHDTRDDRRYNNNNNNNRQQQNGRAPPRGGGMMAKPNSKRPPPAAGPVRDPAKEREMELKRNQSATKIQSHYRGYQARKQYNRPRQRTAQDDRRGYNDDDVKSRDRAASQIQANYRGYRTRKDLKEKNEAATTIQSSARGRNSRNAKRNRDARKSREDEDEAAVKIQSAYRGHRTRSQLRDKEARPPRKQSTNLLDEEDRAATKIQANYRGYRVRKQQRGRKAAARPGRNQKEPVEDEDPFRREDAAATKIQSNFRGHQTRKQLKEQKEAAETIQSGYRGHQSRARSRPSARDDDDDLLRKENQAATKIQANYRGYRCRKQYPRRRKSPARNVPVKEDTYDDLAKENQAATKIQSNYRGYRTRKEYQRTRGAAN